MWDAIVVGGGVAGLTFAKFASRKGLRVLVFEREDEFCVKPCGEYVPNQRIGGLSFEDLYESSKGILKKYDYYFSFFNNKKFRINEPLININKKVVCEELARQAKGEGARIRMGVEAEAFKRDKGGVVVNGERAKLLVGADGYFSKVREFVGGRKPKSFAALQGFANKDLEYPVFHVGGYVGKGYAWAFPGEDEANIGIGFFHKNKSLRKLFEEFCDDQGLNASNVRGGVGPCDLPIKSYYDRVLLVGDSCSQISALSGGGILIAMFCARQAAVTAKKCLDENDFSEKSLKRYESAWREELFDLLEFEYRISRLYRPFLNHLPKRIISFFVRKLFSKGLL